MTTKSLLDTVSAPLLQETKTQYAKLRASKANLLKIYQPGAVDDDGDNSVAAVSWARSAENDVETENGGDIARDAATPLNRGECLRMVDAFLGVSSPPSVEYLFIETQAKRGCHPSQLSRFGHSAVRYCLPDGTQHLVNVCRPTRGRELIEFFEVPEDYIFGVEGQGGIFARNICSVRIEHVPPDAVLAMHFYFRSVFHQFQCRGVNFQLTGGKVGETCRRLCRRSVRKTGNCARWIARGLAVAGLLKGPRMYPKGIWVELIETQIRHGHPDNASVVYYHLHHWSEREHPQLVLARSCVGPCDCLRNIFYFNMKSFAQVHVRVTDVSDEKCEFVLSKGAGRRCCCGPGFCLGFWAKYDIILVVLLALFYVFFDMVWCALHYRSSDWRCYINGDHKIHNSTAVPPFWSSVFWLDGYVMPIPPDDVFVRIIIVALIGTVAAWLY